MKIRPYGDTSNDGKIQMSFTLPIPAGAKGAEAAKRIVRKMGLMDPQVVHMEDIKEQYSFYVVYASYPHEIETDDIRVVETDRVDMSMTEIEDKIAEAIGRDIVFVGASTGTDAHTVGIDAIMNMKGFAGHYGLERYRHVTTFNLGSQVPNEEFVRFAKEKHADVLLVSQTVTQKDVHLKNLVDLVEILEAEGMRDHVILIAGGARITNELAKELGYDAGFGPGKYAEDVLVFAMNEMIRRKQKEGIRR